MAAKAYYTWDALGRPLEPCRPIREYVARLKIAFPRAANQFSWYANDAHYQAVPPEDHTPFSATGWPQASPQWVVFATDVMHRPDLGVDCNVLMPYWLAEARAGRTPWVKYLIWQAKLYDVRNGWKPVANSGHFDHGHLSCRTDHLNTSLGSWSVAPGAPPNTGGTMAQMLIKDTGDGQLYLVDGMFRRKVTQAQIGVGAISNSGVHQAGYLGLLGNNGQVFPTGGDMDVWGALYPPAGSTGDGLSEAEVRDIAEEEAREEIAGTHLVPPQA